MKLTQQECIEKFKIYTKVTKDKSGGITTEYLEGIPGDKKTTYTKALVNMEILIIRQ